MASKTEQRKIQIIADGSSVNASMDQMSKATRLLYNELNKLPRTSAEFAAKSKEFQEVKNRLNETKIAANGTKDALGGMNKMSGLLRQGFDLAVKAFLPLFAFSKLQELVTGIFNLESQWTKLKTTISLTSDLQGEALDMAAIRSEAIAKSFDQTNTEVFANAKVLVKNFGVSYEEAFDLVEKGLLAAGTKGGEFLEQIKEYSVQFADAGASAEDFAAQTVKALNDGIYSDKGADVVKEFGLRIREQTTATSAALLSAFGPKFTNELFEGINNGSITTVEALKRVSKEMNSTEIPAKQLQTIVADVFGGPGEDAGLEYLKNLENMGGSMDDLIDVNNEYVQQQVTRLELEKELATAQEAFTEQFEGSNAVMGNLILQGKIFFFDVLAKGIEGGRTLMVGLINYFIELYNQSLIVRAGAEGIKIVFLNAFSVIKAQFLSAMDGLQGFGDLFKAIFTGNFEAIPDIIKNTFAQVKSNYNTLGEEVAGNFKQGFENLISGEKIALIPLDIPKLEQEVTESVEIIEEGNKRVIDSQTKAAVEVAKSREDLNKKRIDAERALEDLSIQLIADTTERKMAQIDIAHARELAKMDEQKQKVLENMLLSEEEKAQFLADFQATQEAMKAETEAEKREIKIGEQQIQFDEDQEIELAQLENKFLTTMQAEAEYEEARLNLQKEYLQKRLDLLIANGEGQTLEAIKLKNQLLTIDKQIADGKIAEAEREENYKKQIKAVGLETAREFMQLGLDLLAEDSKARKVAALAMKAFEIGLVVTSGIREIQGYYASNAGIPIIGPGLATALSIAAGVRTLGAVNKIRTTQYATGGQTGSGNMIDMMRGGDGTWRMPNGQGTRNVGTFKNGGHIGSASFGVIGEAGSEWVGPNWMMRSPKYANIFGYLEAERRKATPFASGGSTGSAPQIPQSSSGGGDPQQLMAVMEQFGDMSMKFDVMISILRQWPDRLRVYNDPRDIRSGVRVLNEIEADSRINR